MSEGHGGGNNKVIIELIIVLILVGYGLWALNKNSTPSTTPSGTVTEGTSGNTQGGNPTSSASYQSALTQYKNARIQLDPTCQATPKSATFKNGTNVMIDNRSAQTRTVKVGSVFSIAPWGYKIVNLSSPTLPSTWYVDCGTSQNVATILIQK